MKHVAPRALIATLTVKWQKAQAERDFKNKLDGNQNPANMDHVGPNRDDFKWRVFCVQAPDGGPADAARPDAASRDGARPQ